MAMSKVELSLPGICFEYLYHRIKKCDCNLTHLKTNQSTFADSHFHLDRLYKFHHISINDILYPPSFTFMISNFIDPPYHNIDHYLSHPQVFGMIGIHPSQTNDADHHMDHSCTLLRPPKNCGCRRMRARQYKETFIGLTVWNLHQAS